MGSLALIIIGADKPLKFVGECSPSDPAIMIWGGDPAGKSGNHLAYASVLKEAGHSRSERARIAQSVHSRSRTSGHPYRFVVRS